MYKGHANALRIVADEFQVTVKEMRGVTRTPHVVAARQAACMVLSEHFQLSSVEIGKIIRRDHSTVLYSLRNARYRSEDKSWFFERVTASLNRIKSLTFRPCSPRETATGSCMGIGTVCISP